MADSIYADLRLCSRLHNVDFLRKEISFEIEEEGQKQRVEEV